MLYDLYKMPIRRMFCWGFDNVVVIGLHSFVGSEAGRWLAIGCETHMI